MERPVEVAVFHRGELQSVRSLSAERERWAGLAAGVAGGTLVLAAMMGAAAVLSGLGLVIHAPTFFTSWVGVAAVVGYVCSRRTRARLGRYRLGADMDADAFAMTEVDLVRRHGDDYELSLVPGMSGTMEGGRSTLPLEALAGRGVVRLPLPREGKVRVELGAATFVIARSPERSAVAVPLRQRLQGAPLRHVVRMAIFGLPFAALATVMGAVPSAHAVTERDYRLAIPRHATPLEVERLIRARAQLQARSLHQCFDPMPIACQRPGFVGIGLSLSKEGEVLGHWVTRSSYREECPVSECMSNVVATWSFSPMKERMKVVIPVQVRRTNKPLTSSQRVHFVSPDVVEAAAEASTR